MPLFVCYNINVKNRIMSKTISEVQTSKRDLEAKIAQMLLDFENENEVRISGVMANSYDNTANVYASFEPYAVEHNINFTISVEI